MEMVLRQIPTTISIHALREESDHFHSEIYIARHISIHALREESDIGGFQHLVPTEISIHALREESDQFYRGSNDDSVNFNPRSP